MKKIGQPKFSHENGDVIEKNNSDVTNKVNENWNKGEPNGIEAIDWCMQIYGATYSNRIGEWDDYACNNTLSYVCQIPKWRFAFILKH